MKIKFFNHTGAIFVDLVVPSETTHRSRVFVDPSVLQPGYDEWQAGLLAHDVREEYVPAAQVVGDVQVENETPFSLDELNFWGGDSLVFCLGHHRLYHETGRAYQARCAGR